MPTVLAVRPTGLDWRADPVFQRALQDFAEAPGVSALMDCCARFPGTRSKKWRAECERLFAEAPRGGAALERVATLETLLPPWLATGAGAADPAVRFVKGVLWALPLAGADTAVPVLARVVAQHGSVPNRRPGHAIALTAVHALGAVGGERVLAPLRRIKSEAPNDRLRKAASDELDRVLAAAGLSRAEVPEWKAETFELNADGERRFELGRGYTATVRLQPGGRLNVVYREPGGRRMATKPTAADAGAGVDGVLELMRRMRPVIRAERFRLRQLVADQRELPVGEWLHHYLDHPVTGTFSRMLIWEYRAGARDKWVPGIARRLDDDGSWRLWTVEEAWRPLDPSGQVRPLRPLRNTSQEGRFWLRRLKELGLPPAQDQLGGV